MDRNNACSLPLVALSLVVGGGFATAQTRAGMPAVEQRKEQLPSDTARNILSGARAAEAAAAGTR